MYQNYSYSSDDFEPRSIPQRVSQYDGIPIPSVPEVSIISDTPAVQFEQPTQYKVQESPSIETYESYAAWRNKKFPPAKSVEPTFTPSQNNYNSPNRRTPNQNIEYAVSSNHKTYHSPSRQQQHRERLENSNDSSKSPHSISHVSRTPQSQLHFDHKSIENKQQSNEKFKNPEISLQKHKSISKPNPIYQNANSLKSNYHNMIPQSLAYCSSNSAPTANYSNENCELVERYVHPPFHPRTPPHPTYLSPEQLSHHHRHQQLCCATQNMDSSETVKNLLMLVNSQSEQIKCLQMQVDRLLKLHEESLKERQKCSCCLDAFHSRRNEFSEDSLNVENLQVAEKKISKNQESGSGMKITKNDKMQDEKMKQAILEQKVSIGVMTSFEFTVQNNPFVAENERQQEDDREDFRGTYSDSAEMPRKKQNYVSMKPKGLENINEDSESHLSSSQQRSSNLYNMSSEERSAREIRQSDGSHLRTYKNGRNAVISESPLPTMNSHDNKKIFDMNGHYDERRSGRNRDENIRAIDTVKRRENYSKTSSGSEENPICNTFKTTAEEGRKNHFVEESIVLNSDELKVGERAPPSPEPSIHVEMQEYSSDDSSSPPKRTPNVGWTFYNNVLGQVNQILQNSPVAEITEQAKTKSKQSPKQKNKAPMDPVKAATLDQLAKMGISLMDNNETNNCAGNNKKINFDASYYPRLDSDNIAQGTSMMTETNTSLRMRALALKYLNDEQLSDLAVQKQRTEALKQVMVSNMEGTNLSFATMRYLQRYQLLPGNINCNPEACTEAEKENVQILRITEEKQIKTKNMEQKPNLKNGASSIQSSKNCPSKILDITTLKQQAKLL